MKFRTQPVEYMNINESGAIYKDIRVGLSLLETKERGVSLGRAQGREGVSGVCPQWGDREGQGIEAWAPSLASPWGRSTTDVQDQDLEGWEAGDESNEHPSILSCDVDGLFLALVDAVPA